MVGGSLSLVALPPHFGGYNSGAGSAITAQTQSAKAAMKLVTYFEFYLAKSDNTAPQNANSLSSSRLAFSATAG